MRRRKRRRLAFEIEPFVERFGSAVNGQPTVDDHASDDVLLPGRGAGHRAIRIERRRPLWKRSQKRRLRRRGGRGADAEILAARPLGSHQLIAVRRKVQVQGEDLALRQAMLEPHGNHGLAKLRGKPAPHRFGPAARALVHLPCEQQLRDLLTDRRSALGKTAPANVVDGRARDGDRVDSGMVPEPAIFGRQRRVDESLRQLVREEPHRAAAVRASGLIQHFPRAIDDDRRFDPRQIEKSRRQRSQQNPRKARDDRRQSRENDANAAREDAEFGKYVRSGFRLREGSRLR